MFNIIVITSKYLECEIYLIAVKLEKNVASILPDLTNFKSHLQVGEIWTEKLSDQRVNFTDTCRKF